MGLRLAGAGKLIGLSEHQIVAFAGALSSVGLESEAGGTAFSRVWAEMQAAIQTGSEEITTFAKVAGVTRDEFVYAFGRDASDAVLLFLDGLKGMVDTGANVHAELENLGFDSVRIRDSLLRSAGAGDLLSDALNRAEKAWEDNTALTREAELRFESMASQVTFLKNNLYDLRIEVGETLIPALRPLVGIVTDILDKMRIWVSENPQGVLALAKLSVAVLVLGGALIGLIGTISTLRYTIGLWTWLSEAGLFASLGKAFTALGGVAKATFAKMALWGQAAAVAVNTAWARVFLTFKFGGISGAAATAFAAITASGKLAFARMTTLAAVSYGRIVALAQGAAIAVTTAWAKTFSIQGLLVRLGLTALSSFTAIKVGAAALATFLTGGWALAIIGVVTLLLAIWNPIKTFLQGMWQGFKSTFDDISEAFSGLKDQLGELWDAMAPTGSALRELANGILGVGKYIMGLFGDWTEEGKSFGETIGNLIVGVIEGFTILARSVQPIFAVIGGALSGVLDMLGTFVSLAGSAASTVRDSWIGRKIFGDNSVANGAYASGMYHSPPGAILPASTSNQRRTDVNIDRIEITTPDGDPETIAASVGDHLNNMLHNTAENFDDDFAR